MRRHLLLFFALGVTLYLAWYHETRLPLRRFDDPPLRLVVPHGAGGDTIGRMLRQEGLVSHPMVFRLLVRLRGVGSKIRAGEYRIEGPVSLEEILEDLVKGDVVHRTLTVPEGKCLEEIAGLVAAQELDAAAFLAGSRDPSLISDLDPHAKDLEGYLFPDTYDLGLASDSPRALPARMVQRFREVIGPELAFLPERGLTLREVVTLASLVELETARDEERPRVAAVFLNRLKKKMLLQTDPTVIYALRKAGRWDGNIRKDDLSMESPYNTYRHRGLPPGPIASPGRASLLAVLHPAPVPDLYFVSRNDGTHQFSATLSEHERAVDIYQRRRGARTGG